MDQPVLTHGAPWAFILHLQKSLMRSVINSAANSSGVPRCGLRSLLQVLQADSWGGYLPPSLRFLLCKMDTVLIPCSPEGGKPRDKPEGSSEEAILGQEGSLGPVRTDTR